jgi:hypothetical protein
MTFEILYAKGDRWNFWAKTRYGQADPPVLAAQSEKA